MLTCTSTKATPIAISTTLGRISAKVRITSTGAKQTTVTLTDPADNATPGTASATVTATATPVLSLTTFGDPGRGRGRFRLHIAPSRRRTGTGPAYPARRLAAHWRQPAPEFTFTGAPAPAGWPARSAPTSPWHSCTSTAATPIDPGPLGPIGGPGQDRPAGTYEMTATLARPR